MEENIPRTKKQNEALSLIAGLLDSEGKVFQFIDSNQIENIENEWKSIRSKPVRERVNFIVDNLNLLLSPSILNKIKEIHPSWIAIWLDEQPLFLTAMLLKTLPSKSIKDIVKFMNQERQKKLIRETRGVVLQSNLKETFHLIITRNFQLIDFSADMLKEPASILFLLNFSELEILIEELGIVELAIACQNLENKDFSYICKKLPERMQQKISLKIKQYEDIPQKRIAQARQSFLHLKDELYTKGMLIEFTALHILAIALIDTNKTLLKSFSYKLPQKWGEILLKLVYRLSKEKISKQEINRIKNDIVERIIYLSEIDKIRSIWKHFWRGNNEQKNN